jgi:hypothetical protein
MQNSMQAHSQIICAAQDKVAHTENPCCSSHTMLETALNQLTVKEILLTLQDFTLSTADK